LFGKVIRKISKKLMDIQKQAISASMPEAPCATTAPTTVGDAAMTDWRPMDTPLETELAEAGDEATKALREKQREMIDSLDLSR
jgi:N-acetyltransferase 10